MVKKKAGPRSMQTWFTLYSDWFEFSSVGGGGSMRKDFSIIKPLKLWPHRLSRLPRHAQKSLQPFEVAPELIFRIGNRITGLIGINKGKLFSYNGFSQSPLCMTRMTHDPYIPYIRPHLHASEFWMAYTNSKNT